MATESSSSGVIMTVSSYSGRVFMCNWRSHIGRQATTNGFDGSVRAGGLRTANEASQQQPRFYALDDPDRRTDDLASENMNTWALRLA